MNNFSIFLDFLEHENKKSLSGYIDNCSAKILELKKEVEFLKKKNSKFFRPNYRMSFEDVFPFENKAIGEWTPEDVLCWVRFCHVSDNVNEEESFLKKFIESEYYKMGNLLLVEGNCSSLLKTLKGRRNRMRFLLHVVHLRECFKNDTKMEKHLDRLFRKILRKEDWVRMNIERLYGLCEFLCHKENLRGLLLNQSRESIPITIVFNNDYFVHESLAKGCEVEVCLHMPESGPYHTGIMIGDWYFEWNEGELIFPRVITSDPREYFRVSIMDIEKKAYEGMVEGIVECVVKHNLALKYDKKQQNAQIFVNEILRVLNIKVFDPAIRDCLDRVKELGSIKELPSLYIKEITHWTQEDVLLWLRKIGMDVYLEKVFTEKKIDGQLLLDIDLGNEDFREVFVEDPFEELTFQVHAHHLTQNVKVRNILKLENDFMKFAEKFLKQQAEKVSGKLDMNFFDLENSFFIFTNKNALMKYYLAFDKEDKVQLVIIKKGDRTFHSGIMIGKIILEWKSSELVIPRVYSTDQRHKYLQVDLAKSVEDTFLVASKIANIMIMYNSYFSYKEEMDKKAQKTDKNCQHFVDDVLEALHLKQILQSFPKSSDTYLSKVRKYGKNNENPNISNWKIVKRDSLESGDI